MNGEEIENLRSQLNLDLEEFSKEINISVLDYKDYIEKEIIEDPRIINKVYSVQLKAEQDNFEKYGRALRAQETGPFGSDKILYHLKTIANLKDSPQKVTPITLEFHLSNKCNHDCEFCTFRESVHKSENRNSIFPKNLIDQIIEDCKYLGIKAIVYSGGGEPLLYPQPAEIFNKVGSIGIEQGLITNGTNLDNTQISNALLGNFEWIRISIDAGSQEIYEKVHGIGRSLEITLKNIRHLISERGKNKKPQIGVSFLLTNSNYMDLLPSARLFRDIGVDYFQVKPIVITAEKRLSSGNIFWKKQIFDQLLALPAQAVNGKFKIYTLGFKFIDMMFSTYKKPFQRCYGHPLYPVITATGHVYVCCLMIGKDEFCYGKISEDNTFRELWENIARFNIGKSIDVKGCPVNCKLSETNKTLEYIMGRNFVYPIFLN